MPVFGYLDDPAFPRHKEAAFKSGTNTTRGINFNRGVLEMNQRACDRYRRYGVAFDPEGFPLPLTDGVLIEMPLKGSRGPSAGVGVNFRVAVWSALTEAPDETARGPWTASWPRPACRGTRRSFAIFMMATTGWTGAFRHSRAV